MTIRLQIYTTDRSFPYSEEVGDCLCSRCGEPIDTESDNDDDFPIWMWSEDRQRCWRFHTRCLSQQPPLIPHSYPWGLPLNYRSEVSGRLPRAIAAYHNFKARLADAPPDEKQIKYLCLSEPLHQRPLLGG